MSTRHLLSKNIFTEAENIAKKIMNIFGALEKEETNKINFKLYSPREDDPNWDEINERANVLSKEILKTIEVDSGTTEEKTNEAKRITIGLATTAKSMCTNYSRLKKGKHNLLPPYFIWTLNNKCNFRCTYCDNHAHTAYFDLPEVDMLSLDKSKKLLNIMGKNVSGIYFCGGEPTLRKELPELAEYAHSINYFPLIINTNGSRFNKVLKEPRYSRLLKNLDIIIISLDALNTDKLSKVWGVKKDLCEQVLVNILTLRKLQSKIRFKLMVNTVITPETISEANAILDWTNDFGIWYSPVPMNCGPSINNNVKINAEYKSLCDKIITRKKQGYKILGSIKLLEGLLKSKKIKCFPSLIKHVDGDGYLYWPCKTASNLKPVKFNVLDFKSLDDIYQTAEKTLSVTNIHGREQGQCGADCNWMQHHVSNALAKGIEKPLRSGALLEIVEFTGVI